MSADEGPTLTADDAWTIIDARRLAIADLLVELSDEEWNTPSLCADWTVRDVAGHLTQQIGLGLLTDTVRAVAASRGNVPKGMAEVARRTSVRPTGALIADIRRMVGRRRAIDRRGWPFILIDVLVHGEDIAWPLHRALPMSTAGAVESANRAWRGKIWRAQERLAGFRLTADNTDWEVGDGARVSGSIGHLLLLLTGRDVVVPELSGPGAAELRARLGVQS